MKSSPPVMGPSDSPVSNRTASFSILATRAASSVRASARKKVSKPRTSVYPRRRASELTWRLTKRSQAAVQNPPRSPRAIRVSVVRVIRTPTPRLSQLLPQQQPDLERHVLFPDAAGKVRPRIAGVHAPVSRDRW